MRNGNILIIVSLFILVTLCAKGQTIHTKKRKLNEVLNDIRSKYSLLISFDDSFMQTLILPQNKSFKSFRQFLNYLKKNYPIEISRIGKNIILSKKDIAKQQSRSYSFYGKIYDSENMQALSNAEIIIDGIRIYTSPNGTFSYITNSSKPSKLTIKHLGYSIIDTICHPNRKLNIALPNSSTLLNEITVNSNKRSTEKTHIGKKPGLIKLNPNFIKKLPGYGETSIYTFLRLMPGVLATGENSNDISIRGSSEGQNNYTFDGFTVYKPWYKLSDIGTINPFLIKDIEVYKAGYDSSLGENVGSMIKISGKNSVNKKTSLSVFANNFIVNSYLELPVSKKSSFFISARKNIKDEINNGNSEGYYLQENVGDAIDRYYINGNPRYSLADLNIKYLYKLNKDSGFSINMFGSYDKIHMKDFTETSEFGGKNIQTNKDNQYAVSLKYHNNNKHKGEFSIISSYSKIYSNNFALARFNNIIYPDQNYNFKNTKTNSLEEFRLKIQKHKVLKKGNSIDYGIGSTISISNSYYMENDTVKLDNNTLHHLFYGYINTNINLTENINITAGTRINYSNEEKKIYFEPRFSINYYLNGCWKLYASSGIYNQFTYKSYILDKIGNNNFIWTTCNKDIPSLISNNHCLGIKYSNRRITVSSELFYKHIRNQIYTIYSTDKYMNQKSKTKYYGFDLFSKYQNQKLISWISYTYSILKDNKYGHYSRTSFDNRHEIKIASSYNINNKITISSNYIYGTGLNMWHYNPEGTYDLKYRRLDIGAFYKLKIKRIKTELGCSLLNVFNNRNSKLDEFTRFGIGDDIISYPVEGLRRTPSFYIKISL